MTPNPECVGLDTTLVDALHTMHDGKFLHLPVVDQDGCIVACVDVLQLTHGAVATVGSSESGEMASNMLQKFWDSALALEAPETDDDSHSDISSRLDTFGSEAGRQHHHSSGLANSYVFKLKLRSQDGSERNHRLTCGNLLGKPCITIHCTFWMCISVFL
jgi:CBS domain-containing protein